MPDSWPRRSFVTASHDQRSDDVTDKVKKILMGLAALAALALGGAAIAGAANGGSTPGAAEERTAGDTDNVQDENGKDDATEGKEEADKVVTGSAADSARAAAEAKTGGKAGEVEADNENGGAYDVNVTKSDGSEVEVQLDAQFKVLGVEAHDQGDQAGEQDAAGEQGETNDDGAR
jgi:uncharacterized membrane protein YkoI